MGESPRIGAIGTHSFKVMNSKRQHRDVTVPVPKTWRLDCGILDEVGHRPRDRLRLAVEPYDSRW